MARRWSRSSHPSVSHQVEVLPSPTKASRGFPLNLVDFWTDFYTTSGQLLFELRQRSSGTFLELPESHDQLLHIHRASGWSTEMVIDFRNLAGNQEPITLHLQPFRYHTTESNYEIITNDGRSIAQTEAISSWSRKRRITVEPGVDLSMVRNPQAPRSMSGLRQGANGAEKIIAIVYVFAEYLVSQYAL